MSKTLIYLIAIFCLWMYFSFSTSAQNTEKKKPTVKDFDEAESGHGGTLVSNTESRDNSVIFVDHSDKVGQGFGTTGKF